jgi:hypothetical protein
VDYAVRESTPPRRRWHPLWRQRRAGSDKREPLPLLRSCGRASSMKLITGLIHRQKVPVISKETRGPGPLAYRFNQPPEVAGDRSLEPERERGRPKVTGAINGRGLSLGRAGAGVPFRRMGLRRLCRGLSLKRTNPETTRGVGDAVAFLRDIGRLP